MTSLSEQLSAVRQSQWEAQLAIFRSLSNRALDSTEQLISLNLRASRTTVEQATGTFKQLLDATNPGDFVAVGSRAQGQWHYLFEYGRELLGIATGLRGSTWSTFPAASSLQLAASANVPTSFSQALEQASIATADATTVTSEIAAAAVDTGAALAEATLHAGTQAARAGQDAAASAADSVAGQAGQAAATAQAVAQDVADAAQPAAQVADGADRGDGADNALLEQVEAAIETAIADDAPPAKATPLAQALNEVAPKPAGAEHPVSSTVSLQGRDHIQLPVVTPADAEPPVHVPPPPPSPSPKAPRGARSRK